MDEFLELKEKRRIKRDIDKIHKTTDHHAARMARDKAKKVKRQLKLDRKKAA